MKRLAFLATLAMLITPYAVSHHGWSEYDDSRPRQLTGTIAQSGYENPQGLVQLKADDRTWHVVLAPPSRMQSRGLTREMLAPGNRVSVYGHPNRNKAEELSAERITVGEKTTELR